MTSARTERPGADDGFTLVELVMAIIVLFMALTASVQIIVSMVAATVANRHIDLAMSVASQAMESAVAFDCGGQLLDPYWNPDPAAANTTVTAFYTAMQSRCAVDSNTTGKPVGALTNADYCPAPLTSAGHDATKDEDFLNGFVPTFDQGQTDLGSRRFTAYKSAASFSQTSTVGVLPVCTNIKMVWKYIKPFGAASAADDGTNSSVRLQRVVHVQWKEPHSTRVRWREITQIGAVPPDSKIAVNTGRIAVNVGIGKSATLLVPVTAQRMTFGADEYGFVNFPFLPPATYTVEHGGLSTSVVLGTDAKCIPLNGAAALPWSAACHG